jgi:GDPmannose 4,6-dehydratase
MMHRELAKTALIFGISGQDGTYLSRLLVEKGYVVHGVSRSARGGATHSLSMTDAESVRALVARLQPDEVYNLAGLSSVARSFQEPSIARSSIAEAQGVLLDAVRSVAPKTRVYHSSSSECFGDIPVGGAANEQTPFAPRSPYAEAKAAAHEATAEARDRHGLFACSGIVFNHESPLRPETFVTKKILAAARAGQAVALGDLTPSRDWGYAPEYVDAMWRMLQQDEPRDFVLATGESHTVEEFAAAAYAEFGLDHRDYVSSDPSFVRKSELRYSRGDASLARQVLAWEARTKFRDLIKILAHYEQ